MRHALRIVSLLLVTSPLALSQSTAQSITPSIIPSSLSERTTTIGTLHANQTTEVRVFLVVVGDAGKTGKKIGCDDSLRPTTRKVKSTAAPLRAALDELLATPSTVNDEMQNFVFGPNLKVKSVSINKGTATIRFSGRIAIAGICDQPRITEQIEETAKQFPTVKRVKVFVGKETLAQALR